MKGKATEDSDILNLYNFDITGDKVTGVGFRTRIILNIREHHLAGEPVNVNKDRVRVVVQGKEEDVRKFYTNLKENPPEMAENPVFHKIKTGGCAMPGNVHETATLLTLEQIDQGIPILRKIEKGIDNLPQKIAEELKAVLNK